MSEVNNLDTIYSALKSLSLLRANVGDLFKHLVNMSQLNSNVPDVEQAKEVHIDELKSLVGNLNTRFRELEASCTLLCPVASPVVLGNTNLVGHDPNYDKTSLYPDMIVSYRWLDNMQEYSLFAFQALQTNFTKRNSMPKNRQRIRINVSNHIISPQQIDYLVSTLQRLFDIEVIRPFGQFNILKVVLDRTMRVVIVLRGLVIEWVLVKAFDETFDDMNINNLTKYEKRLRHVYNNNMNDVDGTIDIWTPSKYQIFRTITDHSNAAILHFYAPLQMESAIKAYLNWLKSYSTLFSAVCRKCSCRLLNNMPPTWRDFRTNDPYHFECRP